MRGIIFSLLILSQNLVVNCLSLNSVSVIFNEFTELMSKTYYNALHKMEQLFVETVYVKENTPKKLVEKKIRTHLFVDRPVIHNMQGALTDFINDQGHNKIIDPALLLATPQLALWHGRKIESHVILTKDNYFLTVHRITADPYLQANRTVLLHHGLLGSSSDWILLGPRKSLPYILSDAGFDVWITNARGNYYSRGHIFKQAGFSEYWKFSWQEMGEIDLPAVINYIRLRKNFTESINFIGHSMGATALLVLLSSMPKYNDYLRIGILLAPLAYMDEIKGPIKALTRFSEEENNKLFGESEFLPSRLVPLWLASKYCKGPKSYCRNPLLFLTGVNEEHNWSASFIARMMYHVPAGGSTRTLLHYMQLAYSGKFHRFNKPHEVFPLKNITLPIALISSSEDWLASIPNVLKLYFSLPNPVDHHIIRDKNMVHTDFVWGVDANVLVFRKVMEYLEKGLTWNVEKQNELI